MLPVIRAFSNPAHVAPVKKSRASEEHSVVQAGLGRIRGVFGGVGAAGRPHPLSQGGRRGWVGPRNPFRALLSQGSGWLGGGGMGTPTSP